MRPVLLATFGWMGILFIVVMLLTVVDLSRLTLDLVGRFFVDAAPDDPERRLAVARCAGRRGGAGRRRRQHAGRPARA